MQRSALGVKLQAKATVIGTKFIDTQNWELMTNLLYTESKMVGILKRPIMAEYNRMTLSPKVLKVCDCLL